MNKIELRDYQLDIVNQTLNSNKSTLIQIPTGGGKTLIAKEMVTIQHPSKKIGIKIALRNI